MPLLARSANKGLALFGRHCFRLILSATRCINPTHCSPSSVLQLVLLNYSYPVEDGCWWLPVARHGQKCFGAPGLRPSEFVAVFDEMLREITSVNVLS